MELSAEQIEALAYDALRGRNVNNVVHDTNNLFGAIMAYAELIQMGSVDEETNRMLEEILSAVQKGARLVAALTTIARYSEPDALAVCEVENVLESINLLFIYEFKLGLVEATCSYDEVGVSAKIDEAVLQRALMQVVANSIEATVGAEDRKLSIRVSVDGDKAHIAVRNSGDAIASEVAEKMFDSGFSTKGESSLGMGLTLARQSLAAANGTIVYDAEAGFTITVLKAD